MGLAGSMKRLEGKVEAVEVNEKEVEMENEKEEEVENEEDTGGEDVKEVNQGEKNFNETKGLEELENTSEGGDVKRKEEMKNEGNTGEKGKDGKRNSFRLDYIAHMIRR